jgi:hypothetical protein
MATKTYTGGGTAVAQVDHATPANVEIGDVFTMTLTDHNGNEKSLSFTATAATVQNVVEGLQTLADAETVAPWSQVTVTEDDTKLIVTAVTAGIPFTLTCTESDGGGTDDQTFTRSSSTAVAGPSIFDDGDNWGGSVPAAGDDIVIPSDLSVGIYGGDYTSTAYATLRIEEGYEGDIGADGRPLQIDLNGAAYTGTAELAGTGEQWIYLDDCNLCSVVESGSADAAGEAAMNISGIDIDKLHILQSSQGSVSVAGYGGSVSEVSEIQIAGGALMIADDVVQIDGSSDITTLTVTGGSVDCRSDVATLTMHGGSVEYRAENATTVKCWSGRLYWLTDAAITSLYVGGGTMDASRSFEGFTVTNAYVYRQGTVLDPYERVTWSNGLALTGCALADVTLQLGTDVTITPS